MRVTRYSVFLVTLTLTSVKSSPVQTFAPWEPAPTESYLLHDVLDHLGNYHVFWKFNSTHITLEIHVNTSGYVGFGFSPNGKMYPSDVVIGWMKDGISHFSVSTYAVYIVLTIKPVEIDGIVKYLHTNKLYLYFYIIQHCLVTHIPNSQGAN